MTTATPFTPFVMLMIGRTGSSHLTELLASHPNIHAMGEQFVERPQAIHQLEWTRQYFTSKGPSPYRAVGFKTKLRDVAEPLLLADLLRELNVRIIHLRRLNLVKMTVSALNCVTLFEKTGDWNLRNTNDRLGPVYVDPEAFTEKLMHMADASRALEQYVASLGLPTLVVDYEALLHQEAATVGSICNFLDVPHVPMRSPYRKYTPDDLNEAVANVLELRAPLLGTEFEGMFDEDA